MTIHKPEICIAKAQKNDVVSYHYIGRLLSDNSVFGRSFDYNTPYITPLGDAKIIAGMDQGLIGTCLGERRRITIPPHLGYGKKGAGANIPPDSTLVFYIKLLEIERDGISIGSDQTLEAVYNTANRNYEAKNWRNSINAFEFALNLFREFENKTVECVRQCNNNSLFDDIVEIDEILLSSSINGIGSVKDLLPMLQTSKCLQSCRKYSFKSKELDVSYDIIYTFFSKHFYLVLQWAYNQIGDDYNAAVYNQMYYNLYPDVEMAKTNRQYYNRKLGEDYKSVRNRAVTYNTHSYYISGVEDKCKLEGIELFKEITTTSN
ncbi:Peptidyl-prolyl cis-trans isomerase FKBP9-like [Oopsacas minuta]|uniref:peptidylprolyl isomerase n=1 Tax=Oopsacas minuta TaxID=111878 RepID=A0AAV7KI06_9METZ|nr:Peptidyl-prolyl cis-trans isomerase FKBP9-like [Oopsacas minuta]